MIVKHNLLLHKLLGKTLNSQVSIRIIFLYIIRLLQVSESVGHKLNTAIQFRTETVNS